MGISTMNANVPNVISRLINERGLKQKIVAERSGLTAQQFTDLLNVRRLIKVCDIVAIACALEVQPNDLSEK